MKTSLKRILSLLLILLLTLPCAVSLSEPQAARPVPLLSVMEELKAKPADPGELISNRQKIPVKSIKLNKDEATLQRGKTLQLKVKSIKPSNATNKKVAWSSSDEAVATVDKKGKVTAKGIGECEITCIAKDGSGVTAVCLLTVIGRPEDIKYIGNKSSKIFHRSTCRFVRRMNESNKVFFYNRSEALEQKYRPCKVCNP